MEITIENPFDSDNICITGDFTKWEKIPLKRGGLFQFKIIRDKQFYDFNYYINDIRQIYNEMPSHINKERGELTYYIEIIDNHYCKKYLKQCINMGNKYAHCRLGNYYRDYMCYAKMKEQYLIGIEKGDISAAYELGIFYELHNEDNKSQSAIKYLSFAADGGHLKALFKLVEYCKNHKDDSTEIIITKYLLKALNNGIIIAAYDLGEYYYEKKDYDNALKYWLIGRDNNELNSIYAISNYYNTVEKNIQIAKKYLIMAINHSQSQQLLYTYAKKFKLNIEVMTDDELRNNILTIIKKESPALLNPLK